jgi:hypothetical protein
MVANLSKNGNNQNSKNNVSVEFRYEKELHSTRWRSVRQGAIFGIFVGWLSLISYIVYSVGFIFGSILMSDKTDKTSNISDILVVSISFIKIKLKMIMFFLRLCSSFQNR